ncbi:hypothetical protein [Zhihengliuella flava]|uniref:Tail assembly chaperone n=1 Tax=Zhihengliuella flava TaxID=1285193 RepID=A0A931D986_9MICC|nr:hypothetical protein [Zhihengliuella flava]MBG6083236.1 hypothetical protein [Zhihengliuella flava]
MTTRPAVNLSLSKLRKEIKKIDPFRVSLSGSKIVTFPDVYAMESVEAEEIFSGLNRNSTSWGVLSKWLSTADADKLKAEKLSVRELSAVVQAAIAYYEESYGDEGNGNASES